MTNVPWSLYPRPMPRPEGPLLEQTQSLEARPRCGLKFGAVLWFADGSMVKHMGTCIKQFFKHCHRWAEKDGLTDGLTMFNGDGMEMCGCWFFELCRRWLGESKDPMPGPLLPCQDLHPPPSCPWNLHKVCWLGGLSTPLNIVIPIVSTRTINIHKLELLEL